MMKGPEIWFVIPKLRKTEGSLNWENFYRSQAEFNRPDIEFVSLGSLLYPGFVKSGFNCIFVWAFRS